MAQRKTLSAGSANQIITQSGTATTVATHATRDDEEQEEEKAGSAEEDEATRYRGALVTHMMRSVTEHWCLPSANASAALGRAPSLTDTRRLSGHRL